MDLHDDVSSDVRMKSAFGFVMIRMRKTSPPLLESQRVTEGTFFRSSINPKLQPKWAGLELSFYDTILKQYIYSLDTQALFFPTLSHSHSDASES